MTQATLHALKVKFTVVAAIWKWMDHKGREYRVFFRTLNPECIPGCDAYRAEMLRDVVLVVT